MKIVRTLSLILAVGAVLLASCQNSFSGTSLKGEEDAQAAANSADRSNVGFTTAEITIPNPLATAAASQNVIISFAKNVDADTIATAFTFYNLANAADADGAPTRGTANSFTVREVRKVSNTQWDAYITFTDLTAASATVEVFVDPTKLTAEGGTLKLDLDGDNVQGETGDDDAYFYRIVTGGAAASGAQRDPRNGFNVTATSTSAAVGTTSWTITYSDFALDNTDYKALFDSIVELQKFDYTAGTWSKVTLSSTSYTPANGQYVMNFPAFLAGETYRARAFDLVGKTTTKTLYGYQQKMVDDLTDEAIITTQYVLDTNQLTVANQNAAMAVSSTFDANNQKGYVTLNFNTATIGTEGLQADTVTTANIKLLQGDVLIPVSSVTLRQQDPTSTTNKNNQVILTLNQAYTATGAAFNVLIGPGLKMLGDSASLTTDDRYFGDQTASGSKPYGFATLNGATL